MFLNLAEIFTSIFSIDKVRRIIENLRNIGYILLLKYSFDEMLGKKCEQ